MNKIKLHDGTEIDLPDGDIGIMVSGGADSAILLHLLMSNISNDRRLYVFCVGLRARAYGNLINVAKIIQWNELATGFKKIKLISRYVDSQTNENLYEDAKEHLKSGKIKLLYDGLTAMPPADVANSFGQWHLETGLRDPSVKKPVYDKDFEVHFPFVNKDKKFIHDLYVEHDIMELFDLTNSCVTRVNTPTNEHCGQCWHCKEREWAFEDNYKSKVYVRMPTLELGNLSKIHEYLLSTVAPNIKNATINLRDSESIVTDLNLKPGNELTVMKYGNRYFFYTLKGEGLKHFFDDWEFIQKQIETQVGKVTNTFPLIACGFDHVYRHIDSMRGGSVNAGLLNCRNSTMCFWDKNKMIDSLQYDIGDCYLIDVTRSHSVVIDDRFDQYNFRAILMWTTEDKFKSILDRMNIWTT